VSNTTCLYCQFFAPQCRWIEGVRMETDEGECRRHSPSLGVLCSDCHGEEIRQLGEWPQVMGSDWCGEFRVRTRTKAMGPT